MTLTVIGRRTIFTFFLTIWGASGAAASASADRHNTKARLFFIVSGPFFEMGLP